MDAIALWKLQLEQALTEFAEQAPPVAETIFIVGCSTSEVAGARIGTNGALEIGEALFEPLRAFADKHHIHLAFQGCEHINRAVTLERKTAQQFQLEPVSVVPVFKAGGSMSTCAYKQFEDPVVVETVQASAGIDIGQTLIGMQMKPVVVPIRTSIKQVGEAIITLATTRPKLIGGSRAHYE
ncbi:TIGR01440 family protein [Sporosarcina sp. GW1-11]|uniref:TIGR01440 family protein n=1 Tax=Sporosarcina sp. GW1-11 TaxID=2899126 RepID=UPI00294F7AEA|nr:TIGR01440 family protein [Sporosarcina sp. GW1-11]MDV6378272.1 TIGR01440 family protein [Sporosarcina sp. GW1-11]